jgi:hypothetical protein
MVAVGLMSFHMGRWDGGVLVCFFSGIEVTKIK